MTGCLDGFDTQRRRGLAVAIEAMQLALGPDQGEGIAADAIARRLDHGQRGGSGDGGIDGIAALLQNFDTGLGRQRLGGGDHPAPGKDALALRRIGVFVGREIQHGKRLFDSEIHGLRQSAANRLRARD